MVTDVQLAVLGTIAGALIGGGIGVLQYWIRESNENKRHWTRLVFDKKYESLIELQFYYNKLGRDIGPLLYYYFNDINIREYVEENPENVVPQTGAKYIEINGVLALSYGESTPNYEPYFQSVVRDYEELLHKWSTASIFIEDGKKMRKGIYLYEKILTKVAKRNDFSGPHAMIEYHGELEVEDGEKYREVRKETQEQIKAEILNVLSQFRK